MKSLFRFAAAIGCAVAVACGGQTPANQSAEEELSNAVIHPTVEQVTARTSGTGVLSAGRNRGGGGSCPSPGGLLSYHGGVAGVGVETSPTVYLVYWGSQWDNNDPSGEAAIQNSFFSNVGGSSWNNSVTQYCEGVASGTTTCPSGSTQGGNPAGVLAGVWYDNASAAPSRPSQSQLAAEAVNAAAHFGNTAAGSNDTTQYVINTATRNNSSGFGRQYCAYHSSTTDASGNHIAWTNMPYITDAGGSCGANFNGLGATAGITIVGGHEFAETESDQFPNGGWLDQNGGENGDKCAWIPTQVNGVACAGASANVGMGSASFPVQSLWSNANNGCVLSF
jgi:serine protease